MTKSRVYLYLILANLFWAGNYVFGKYVVAELSPVQMTFMRWLIAVLVLFPIAQMIEKPDWRKIWRAWPLLLLLAVLGVAGYNFLLYEALQYTTSLNAALVNAMNPALIVLVSALVLKERISTTRGLGLVLSLLGVLLVLTEGHLSRIFQINYNAGDLLMLLAITVWTVYSILGRRTRDLPPIASTAVSALLAVLLVFPFALASGLSFHLSPRAAAGILYIGLFPSVGSFICWNSAIRVVGASRAGIYLNLITVFTAVFSVLSGNPVTWAQGAGGLLVFAGVYLASVAGSWRPHTDHSKSA
ncbi:DMT family transporter [Paenibacillus sp. CN-4]|uniref:DMT family transporter n=1 Tax=Paenibacillus nanchangensis TaxID=3348343 RepID=UPI00397CF912